MLKVDKLFSNPPLTEIKRKPKPPRSKRKQPTSAEKREAGLKVGYNWKTYEQQTPEEREQIKGYVIRNITERKNRSIRFKRYRNRLINSSLAVQHGRPTRKCTKCGKIRGLTMFDKLKDPKKGKNVRRPYCMICRKHMNAEYYRRRKNAIKP